MTQQVESPRGRLRGSLASGASRFVATLVTALMVVSGSVVGASAANAADPVDTELGMKVTATSVEPIDTYTHPIAIEQTVDLGGGVSLQAGAVSTLRLDSSLRLANFDNTKPPSGAQSQIWDPATNTLTVVWGAMVPGKTYSVLLNTLPSALATQSSTFQAFGTLTGKTSGGADVTQRHGSAPKSSAGSSEIPVVVTPVEPGAWDFPNLAYIVQPNEVKQVWPSAERKGAPQAFENLTLAMLFDEPVASGAQKMPRSWLTNWRQEGSAPVTTVVDSDEEWVVSHGAFGGGTASKLQVRIWAKVPETAEPGVYQATWEVRDTRADGEVVVDRNTYTLTIPEPTATEIKYRGLEVPAGVAPGGLFNWGQRIGFDTPSGAIKDLSVTLAVPENATLRAVSLALKGAPNVVKSVEYTTEDPLNGAAQWLPLPFKEGSQGIVAVANPEAISGIRYTYIDRATATPIGTSGAELVFEADNDLQPGDIVPVKTVSVTYIDPVAGFTSLASNASFEGTIPVRAQGIAPATAGLGDGRVNATLPTFDQVISNGNTIEPRLWFGSDTLSGHLEAPYVFAVLPPGMTSGNVATRADIAEGWKTANAGFPVVFPDSARSTGQVSLPGGATLVYVKMDNGALKGSGSYPLEVLMVSYRLKAETMLAGNHTVLFGAGSMSSDLIEQSAKLTSDKYYSLGSLKQDQSFGSYSGNAEEIRTALKDLGVASDSVFLGERAFSISPSSGVDSKTTIQGSEDTQPIEQSSGMTATSRPGGVTHYKVAVTNTGSAVYNNFEFIDVLPYQGDTYVSNPGADRNSEFDVNLLGNIEVFINGKASEGARISIAKTSTPERFDSTGATISATPAGEKWMTYSGSASGAKAIKVELAGNVEFGPGDVITLEFDGTVPSTAPRNGELANNSVAYRFLNGGKYVVGEPLAVAVKTNAPSGKTELSGQSFLDLNANGVQDSGEAGLNGAGVTLQLYVKKSGKVEKVGSPVSPNVDGSLDGVFSFIGLDPNESYFVKPESSNPNVSFHGDALDGDGFLKYRYVADPVNGPADTSSYDGKSEFLIGDEAGIPAEWIKNLRVPVIAKTTIGGQVLLTDVNDSPLTPGAFEYAKGISVTLKKGASQVTAPVTTNENGEFEFKSLSGINVGDYTLEFELPSGSKLVTSAYNGAEFTPGTGGAADTYALDGLVPGTGAQGIRAYYTDDKAPTASGLALTGGLEIAGASVNPTNGTWTATDKETHVARNDWQILAADSSVVKSGKTAAGVNTVAVPQDLADADYTLSVTSTDYVGNVSAPVEIAFTVDHTAPALTSTETAIEYVKGSPATPTTDAGWISLFGVTAPDAGVGMPTTGTLGVTVDSSDVKAGAGTFEVIFTATDLAGNTTEQLKVTYNVSYVGDPTITLENAAEVFELGETALTKDELIDLFKVTAAEAHITAPIVNIAVDFSKVKWDTLGTYDVTFQAEDALGTLTEVKTGKLTVQDTIAPDLTLDTTTVVFDKGDTELDPADTAAWIDAFGAKATDTGSGVKNITVDASGVDYTTAGTYDVKFIATDNAGNVSETVVGKCTVKYAGDPTIVMSKPAVITHEFGVDPIAVTDAEWIAAFGVTAEAAPGSSIGAIKVDATTVKWDKEGDYTVTFTVTDNNGLTASVTGTVKVKDTTPPTLKLDTPEVTFVKGDTKLDPADAAAWVDAFKAKASDGKGTGLDGAIAVDASAVDYTTSGSYPVVFTVKDKAQPTANTTTVTGTYVVKFAGDPVITLANAGPIAHEWGDAAQAATSAEWIALFDASAKAAAGSTITSLTADGSAVNWNAAGTYKVHFTAVDSNNNTVTSFGEVIVSDTINPKLTLTPDEVSFVKGDTAFGLADTAAWVDAFGAAASDAGSGINATGIVTDTSAVDYTKIGTYNVVFTVTDKANNTTTVTGKYHVTYVGDPTIEFKGADTKVHEFGEAASASTSDEWIALFGATAKAVGGAKVVSFTADGSAVKWDVEGDYPVVFTVTDDAGTVVTRTATLTVKDTTAPVATLDKGERKNAMVAPGTPWTATEWVSFFGAKATDGAGTGVDEGSWAVTESVNWNAAGTYDVSITVKDKANSGNTSKVVIGKITIQAPPKSATVETRIPQNDAFLTDPIGQTSSTGTLEPLTDADLGTPSEGGTLALAGGQVNYTPKNGFHGDETFSITVTDDLGQTGTIEYLFHVVEAPGLVKGASVAYTTVVDQSVTIEDAAALPQLRGENLTVTGVATPAGFSGKVTEENGTITFTTADELWAGNQEFTFEVTDDLGQSADIPVQLTVLAPTMSLAASKGLVGTETEVTLGNLVPNAEYALELHSTPLALTKVTADKAGTAVVTVAIPKDAKIGEHHIVLLNSDQLDRAEALFTVLAPGTTGGEDGDGVGTTGAGEEQGGIAGLLSATGASPAGLALAAGGALVLILAAFLLFAAARRRKEEEEEAEQLQS